MKFLEESRVVPHQTKLKPKAYRVANDITREDRLLQVKIITL
jgi:hypothetical protein